MKNFEVKGQINHNQKETKFTKIVQGKDEADAREKLFCLVGGKEKRQRREIIINEITEVKK
jgi:ribosomal protein L20A (L18A)